MEAKSEIISFDCACRTLAWVWATVDRATPGGLKCTVEASKKDKTPPQEVILPTIVCRGSGIADFVGGPVKEFDAAERAAKLAAFLNGHSYLSSANVSPDATVLIESQPFTRNEYSFAVSQQLAFYYAGRKVVFVNPVLKNRVYFADLSHLTFSEAEKGKHGGKSASANAKYSARKKHAAANMIQFCADSGADLCTGVKKSQLNNVGDALMQMVAYLASNSGV